MGILTALYARTHTGQGQHIDVSLFDSSLAMLGNVGMNHLATGSRPPRLGNAHASIVPYQVFAASDGHFIVACGNDHQFIKLCQALGQLWHHDDRFTTNPSRVAHRDSLVPLMQAVFDTQSRAYWLDLLDSQGIPCGSINGIDEALNLPQTHDRQMVVSFDDGLIKVLGNPIKLSATPAVYTRPPPQLGQDNDDILAKITVAESPNN